MTYPHCMMDTTPRRDSLTTISIPHEPGVRTVWQAHTDAYHHD